MSKVIFIYIGKKIEIQCQKEEKMKDICRRFANKVGEKFIDFCFLYNGKKLDLNSTFKQTKSFLDFNSITVLAIKQEVKVEKLFICPYCGENIDSYNRSFYDLLSINDNIINEINGLKRKLEEINDFNNMHANIIYNELKRIINEVQKKKDEIKKNMREIYVNNSKRSIINIKINTNK